MDKTDYQMPTWLAFIWTCLAVCTTCLLLAILVTGSHSQSPQQTCANRGGNLVTTPAGAQRCVITIIVDKK